MNSQAGGVPSKPAVLVVLPTLGNRLDSLASALASVDAQRGDVRVTLALVVPPGAEEAMRLGRQSGALIVQDPGRGMSAAMNAGRSVATTERYTIWLGDDDGYREGGLAHLVSLLDSHPRAVVAYGACDYVDSSGQRLWTSRAGSLAKLLLPWGPNLIPHPAALLRLDSLEKTGGYDESLHLAMDLDLFLRLKRLGEFVATKKVVAQFGWHPDSLTVSGRKASAAEARLVKRRHLPAWLRPLDGLWEIPVALASRLAASRLNRRSSPGTSR